MTLSSLLPCARSKRATDPRDKIFAFTNLLSAVPESLQADYGEETKCTFIKAAQLLMEEDFGLRLLTECEFNSNSRFGVVATSLPSWVPDWAQSRQCESLPGGLLTSPKGHEFSAGTHLLSAVDFKILNDVLVLDALIWDDIVFTDPLATKSWYRPQVSERLQDHLDVSPLSHGPSSLTMGNILCDGWRDFNMLCEQAEKCNRDPNGFRILDVEERWTPGEVEKQYQKIIGRSLMLTSENYVGWAPPAAAVGDVISIIPGCHVPIVLRKIYDHGYVLDDSALSLDVAEVQEIDSGERLPSFSVIGEAYLHGVMEGEASFSLNKGNKKLQKIALV